MKKRELNQLNLLGGLCFVLGVLFALNSIDGFIGITGNVISDKAYASLGSFFGIFFFLLGISIFVSGAFSVKETIDVIAKRKNWITYPLVSNSITVDTDKGYLNNADLIVRLRENHPGWPEVRLKKEAQRLIDVYTHTPPEKMTPELEFELSILDPQITRTPVQQGIERSLNRGELILPYLRKDNLHERKKYRGEMVNKRNSFRGQFDEGHAAKGGRVIDLASHIVSPTINPFTWFTQGRLKHFNKLADGDYIWIVDTKGNFVLANRGAGAQHEKELQKGWMIHDMPQMPVRRGLNLQRDVRKTFLPHATLAKGEAVYGAGEVTIKDGLIERYNPFSGHYAKLIADSEHSPREPYNFCNQSLEVFRHFAKKYGWKEVRGGAKYDSEFPANK